MFTSKLWMDDRIPEVEFYRKATTQGAASRPIGNYTSE